MMKFDRDEIMRAAEQEIKKEHFRAAVEKMKAALRKRRPIWDWLFPYRIVILSKKKEFEK